MFGKSKIKEQLQKIQEQVQQLQELSTQQEFLNQVNQFLLTHELSQGCLKATLQQWKNQHICLTIYENTHVVFYRSGTLKEVQQIMVRTGDNSELERVIKTWKYDKEERMKYTTISTTGVSSFITNKINETTSDSTHS